MRRNFSSGRPAFTLVELLVVIAIIGILVALLLPAVQAAREAARRMSCSNNLKNLALGCHGYHDVHGTFPPGHLRGGDMSTNTNNRECWGWHVFIMPFIEQKPLYDQLDPANYRLDEVIAGANPAVPDPVTTLQTKVDVFVCPSDNGDDIAHKDRHFGGGVGGAAAGLGQWRPGLTTYVGMRGVLNKCQDTRDCHGIFFYDSKIKIAKISDGTSNTLMIGERESRECRSGVWLGVRNPNGDGSRGIWYNIGTARSPINQPTEVIAWGNDRGCGEGFSSNHAGGAMFALCDGSVRFLSDTIEHREASGDFKVWDDFAPGNGDYAWYGAFSRLARRDDGFPLKDF